jgi:phage gp36-like protein
MEEAIALTNLEDSDLERIDDKVLNRALEDADAEVDGYLSAAGYTLPLATAPLNLRNKCCDIARYRLDRNRPREDVRQRYEDAIAFLKDLASGRVKLPIGSSGGDGTLPDSANSIQPQWYTSDRVFTPDTLRGY